MVNLNDIAKTMFKPRIGLPYFLTIGWGEIS